jgi:hypothetical protein
MKGIDGCDIAEGAHATILRKMSSKERGRGLCQFSPDVTVEVEYWSLIVSKVLVCQSLDAVR